MKTYIVMPVANEEAAIADLLARIRGHLTDARTLVVMDRFSRDRTMEIVHEISLMYPDRVSLLLYPESTGFASCYLYGFRAACNCGADSVIEMDGGGSHDPAVLPRMVELLRDRDCVFSSRFAPGGGFESHPLQRRLISWAGTKMANALLSTKLSDMTSGFEGFRASVLRAIDRKIGFENFLSLQGAQHFFQTEMRYYCSRLHWAEIPIQYRGSSSTLKAKTVWNSFNALYTLGCRRPIEPGELT